MEVITAIKNQRTVHTYSEEALSDTHIAEIKEFIRKTSVLFGTKVRVQLLRSSRLSIGTNYFVLLRP